MLAFVQPCYGAELYPEGRTSPLDDPTQLGHLHLVQVVTDIQVPRHLGETHVFIAVPIFGQFVFHSFNLLRCFLFFLEDDIQLPAASEGTCKSFLKFLLYREQEETEVPEVSQCMKTGHRLPRRRQAAKQSLSVSDYPEKRAASTHDSKQLRLLPCPLICQHGLASERPASA